MRNARYGLEALGKVSHIQLQSDLNNRIADIPDSEQEIVQDVGSYRCVQLCRISGFYGCKYECV
jgi:hypothetical protein